MVRRRLKAISLFSGMGGMDLGLERAGIKVVLQVDNDPFCYETLRANRPRARVLLTDISTVSGEELLEAARLTEGSVDLVVGGPSCQPFSRSNEGRRRGAKDPRGKLIFKFARIVQEICPEAFIMENVQGLSSSNNGHDINKLIRHFSKIGYIAALRVLNAADYGVPQKRRRLFLIGLANGGTPRFPYPTHSHRDSPHNGVEPHVTSGEALADLDDGENHDGSKTIGGKYGRLLNDIPLGMNYLFYTRRMGHPKPLFHWRSKFWPFLLKLDPDQPSSTIQARPGPYVGPFHWRNRRLTITEIKRLQTIPDSWLVSGVRDSAYTSPAWRQIGEAVPTLLMERIGETLLETL